MMSMLDALADEAARRVEEREQSPKKHAMTLTDFGDDMLAAVFQFLPNIQELRSFSLVNKRASRWMLESTMTNRLFGIAYEQDFGDAIAARLGRIAWKQLYKIRRGLSQGMKVVNKASSSDEAKSVGILTSEREMEAIGYDHPRHFQSGQCLGYFGMTRVFPDDEKGPLIIWGDFDGVYVVSSPNDLLPSDTRDEETRKADFHKLPGDSQVLSVVSSPLSVSKDMNATTFFLGYASGSVQAVKAVRENERYSYEVVSTSSSHTDEVTSLSVLPFKRPCLASSSVDGTVRLYPDSFWAKPTLDNAALMFQTTDPSPKILCVAAVNNSYLICTGDDSGHLTLRLPEARYWPQDESFWKKKPTIPFDLGGSLPTFIFFHPTKNILVAGTNRGGLLTFRPSLTHELELIPLNSVQTAHVGTIESAQLVGNILLTSSANEGHVMGWDVRTLLPIGSLPVHPGRLYQPSRDSESRGVVLRSAVMSTILSLERGSLLCLCRDGTVREFSFGSSAQAQQSEINDGVSRAIPQNIASLQSFMSNADLVMRGRMQMRIVQAGLQNKKQPQASFVGVDGQTYEDTEASFDHFSDLEPCTYCSFRGEGAFHCRVVQKHSGFDDASSRSVRLFKKLQKSKSAWLSNGEETWVCQCTAENQIDKKRCFLCMKWKGGKRDPFAKKKPGDTGTYDDDIMHLLVDSEKTVNVVSWEDSMNALAESPVKITEGDRPGTIKVWECKACMRLNHWNLHSCHSCERRTGGKALHIPWTMPLEPKEKGPSSLVANAHTSCPSLSSLESGASSRKRKKSVDDTPKSRPSLAPSSSSEGTASDRKKKKQKKTGSAGANIGTTKESSEIWNASIAALSESSAKVTEGDRLGTIKVWECNACSHMNHWKLYNCSTCGKRAGGKTWEIDWPSTLESSSEVAPPAATLPLTSRSSRSSISSSSSANASRDSKKSKKKVSTSSDDWTCHRCDTENHGSALCRKCFGSRNKRRR